MTNADSAHGDRRGRSEADCQSGQRTPDGHDTGHDRAAALDEREQRHLRERAAPVAPNPVKRKETTTSTTLQPNATAR